MKKSIILTSVLALAACGGGNGGAGFVAPNSPVVPNTSNNSVTRTVDSNTGLGMIDINSTRSANYERAIATVNNIENNHNVDTSVTVRSASRSRTSGLYRAPSANTNYTADDVDNAYNTMRDIFVNSELEGKTVHEVLESLALTGLNETEIMDILGGDESMSLTDRVKGFITVFETEEQNDQIKKLVKEAREIYQDFGKEFDITLEKATFYLNSNDSNWYKFKFDENGTLTGLVEKDGTVIPKDKNGTFIKEKSNGYEYSFAFKGHEESLNADYGGKIDLFYETEPEPEDLKADFLDAVKLQNSNWDDKIFDAIEDTLDKATVYSMKDILKEEVENHIVGRHADVTEKVRIETGSKDLGLMYSDFGLRYEESELGKNDDYISIFGLDSYTYTEHGGFIGGYEDKQATPESEMTFKGQAYVGLTRKQGDAEIDNSDTLLEPQNNYYNGDATFSVKTAKDSNALEQKLVADFSENGWYEVTVDNMAMGQWNPNNNNITFAFNDKGNNIDEKWQVDPENQAGEIENINIKYYGPESDNPTEAVGFVQYIENHNSNGDWTFKADISFGAKKQ